VPHQSPKDFAVLIEQAIFTSAQTGRRDGYQVVAHSPDLDEHELAEIARHSPSHDALWDEDDDARSVSFYPLPSGRYCVSQSTWGGQEFSARRGPKVYTQCLVATTETMAALANNPFALLAAAFAQGQLRVLDKVPADLEPFRLCGRAAPVDEALLQRLASDPGITWLQALVEAALTAGSVALLAPSAAPCLIAGLIHCLPLECRLQFSFSTGLKYSPRRPLRVVCLGGNLSEQRRLAERYGLTVVEISGKPPKQFTATSGWGGFIASALAAGKTAFLAEQLSASRPGLSLADLAPLGDQLLERMADGPPGVGGRAPPIELAFPTVAELTATVARGTTDERRADAAHFRFASLAHARAETAACELREDPSQVVGDQCPVAIEKLEQLDDLVFETIAGKPGALDALRRLWPEVLAQVGPSLVEESREQYLRHALNVWKDCIDGDQIHNPSLALATMEVLCLLFGDK
jgi:hypothetical protein